jgi:ketosteroid isomerase-like protein
MKRSERRVVPVLVATLCAAVAAGAASAPAAGTARAGVEAGNKKFAAAVERADATALAGLYTPEAQVLPPNAEIVKGRAAIESFWKSVLATGVASLTLTTVDLQGQGLRADEVGTYSLKLKDGTVADRGKYLVVWTRVGGQWLIDRDIWNTSMPPARP